jgi:hypothetical protein
VLLAIDGGGDDSRVTADITVCRADGGEGEGTVQLLQETLREQQHVYKEALAHIGQQQPPPQKQ